MIQLGNISLTHKFSALWRKLIAIDDGVSRFQYAVLVSLMLHAIVLFAVTIRPPDLSKSTVPPSLEVILVNARSSTQPAKVEVLAQQTLDGGGNTDADRRAKSPLRVTRTERQNSELTMESRRVQQLEPESKRLVTQVNSQAKVDTVSTQPPPQQAESAAAPNSADIMNRSLEIARLEAEISKSLDDYSKRPRRKFLGPNTQEYRFTRYIEDWRVKVERVGTQNYPQAARDQKIYGSLRLTVSIRADGTIEKVEIDRSSGKKVLDDAAIRIVNQAAPYAAFPANISKDVDILSITKTWTFTMSDQFSTE